MELIEGETLAARLKRGPLSLKLAVEYGFQITDALAAAHDSGLIHRDLKPGNIMICKSGIKILDSTPLLRREALLNTLEHVGLEMLADVERVVPRLVAATAEADEHLAASDTESRKLAVHHEMAGEVTASIWARAGEHALRLALVAHEGD